MKKAISLFAVFCLTILCALALVACNSKGDEEKNDAAENENIGESKPPIKEDEGTAELPDGDKEENGGKNESGDTENPEIGDNEEKPEIGDNEEKPVKPEQPHIHTPAAAVKENEILPNCSKKGSYDLVIYCADENCGKEIERKTEFWDKREHIPEEAVRLNEVAGSCTEGGSYDLVVFCVFSDCREELERTTVALTSPGHDYIDRVCSVCKEKMPSEGLSFRLSEDESYYKLVGVGSCEDGYVVIPSEYESKPVKSIGNYAFYNSEITGVMIPASVEDVEACAFYLCGSLTVIDVAQKNPNYKSLDGDLYSKDGKTLIQYAAGKKNNIIRIPDTVETVKDNAFTDCRAVKTIVIPKSVTTLEKHCLPKAGGFNYIYYTGSRAEWNAINKQDLVIANNHYITYDYIPENLRPENTPSEGFSYSLVYSGKAYMISGVGSCPDIHITIPSEYNGKPVVSISNEAFAECYSLKSIVIPESIVSVGSSAFKNCINLERVEFCGESVSLGEDAFAGCDSLKFNLYDNAKYIGNEKNPYLILVKVLATSIESCEIHKDTKSVARFAFSECTSIENIVLPEGLKLIGHAAFNNCSSLTSIILFTDITSIEDYAFSGCTALTDVYYGGGSSDWASIDFGDNLGLNNVTLHFYYGTEPPEEGPKYSERLSFELSEDGTYYILAGKGTCIDEHILIPPTYDSKPVKEIGARAFYDYRTLEGVTIPDSVEFIGDNAFSYCYALKTVNLGNGLKSLGHHVFSGCTGLEEITIPSNVEIIGEYAFSSCSALKTVVLENGLKTIGEGAFASSAVENIEIPESVETVGNSAFFSCRSLKSIAIPDGIEQIGEKAFCWCTSLESIVIPKSVNSIGENAFHKSEALSVVYYGGSEEEFAEISVSENNAPLHSATVIYDYEPN